MKVRDIGYAVAAAAAMTLTTAGGAQAYSISIDQFYIQKNSGQYVNDTFSDNFAPPSSESSFGSGTIPVTYNTLGGWTESGGRAQASSASGFNTTSATTGNPITFTRARVNSNTNPTDFIRGLKPDDTFEVRGLFDLSSTLDLTGNYGIRLGDSLGPTNAGVDRAQIAVRRSPSGQFSVSFSDTDLTAGISTELDADTLASGHDQILLVLTRATTSSGITASYAYVDGGSIDIGNSAALAGLSFNSLNGEVDLFTGAGFTQAEFYGLESEIQVPEPGMLTILGLAVAGLGISRHRKPA